MKEAFTYVFKDPGYSKKALVYFMVCFITLALMASPQLLTAGIYSESVIQEPQITPVTNPLLIIFISIIGYVFNMFLTGYYYTCIHAIVNQQNNIVLPYMNFGNSFIKGLKFTVAIILISSLVGLLFVLTSFAGLIVSTVLAAVLLLFFGMSCVSFMWIFAIKSNVSVFFAWKEAVKLINQNKNTYYKNWFVFTLLIALGALLSTLFMALFNFLFDNIYLAWIASSIEGAIIASYVAFVGMYLVAKSIKPLDITL